MLELKNVSFTVDSENETKEIIHDVTLKIPQGKLIVVTGPNGGGKSTLAKLIAGINNCGTGDSEHDGIHRFFMGKNARIKYVESYSYTNGGLLRRLYVLVGCSDWQSQAAR